MNFLYPGFLFALLAVIIPILIHLFNFRKFKEIYFSNVAFLKDVKEQNSSREKLKNILLLIARILAIIFLVLAFARPYLSSVVQEDFSRHNIISIYLDNSYSMGAVNKEGSLLDEAKRRAKDVVNVYGINDKFQILTNDFEGKHQRLINSNEVLQAIEEIKISSATRTLQQIINRQQSVFIGNSNRSAYLISDFQKGFTGNELIKKDSATNISLIQLAANPLPNISVDSVWSLSPVHRANTSAKLIVRLKNLGSQEVKNVPLKLSINDQQKAVSTVTIGANSFKNDTLSYNGLSVGWQKGNLSIKDFPITFDDELNFSFNVSENQQILAINGQNIPYLRALFAADPYFKFTEVEESNINYSAFSSYSLIILNGLAHPSSGLANELKNYITNGGSVVIFPNLDVNIGEFSTFLTTLKLPAVAELISTPTQVSSLALDHRLFKNVFESLPKNLNLPLVNRYFTFADHNRMNKEVLLQLPAQKPYLARYGFPRGQVFLAASGLNEADGNLAKHPLFVPLLYKIAFESAQTLPLFYTISTDNTVTLPTIKLGKNQSLRIWGEGLEVIPEISQQNGKTVLYVADQLKKPGFYELKKSNAVIAILAFNTDRRESNMNYDTQAELESRFGGKKGVNFINAKTNNISSAIAKKNNGSELWKLCLILSLVFIAVEILLVRFLNTTTNTKLNEPVN